MARDALDCFQQFVAALGHGLDALRRDLELGGIGCAVIALVRPGHGLNEKFGMGLDVPFQVRNAIGVPISANWGHLF
jgi:hypothetical protein